MSRTATPRDLIPPAHCVLGTMLRPLSLGRHLLLTCVASPFAGNLPDREANPEDLALAVFICGAKYAETLDAMLAGEWDAEFKRWQEKLRAPRWRKTPFNARTEMKKFRAYLDEGYARPPVWRHETAQTVKLTAPWECLLKCRLVAGGFAAADVLEQYLPAAWYDYYTLAELDQLKKAQKPSDWLKVFYTASDHARLRSCGRETAANQEESPRSAERRHD